MRSCFVVLALLFFALPAIADTYSWVDDQGTVNFSEDPGSIPKKYRKKARVIGDEEPAPSQATDEKEKPAAIQQPTDVTQGEKRPQSTKVENKIYGGKDAQAWKSEFEAAHADVKAAEKQLVEYRSRLQDTKGMSRTEYLSIVNTIKMTESSVLGQRKKLEELKQDAEKAGVPPQLME